ncbi:MAG: hypothetical protein E7K04_01330 [Helicobacter sp.]|nr:hypothetical protein [Helicobacter sp.]
MSVYKASILGLALLAGCVDINIKSVLPKESIYNIDNLDLKNRTCKAPRQIAIGGINSVNFIDSRSMIEKSSNGQISTIENITWIDNPKNMLQNLLQKQAYNSCIDLTDANAPKTLFITIFFMGFKNGAPQIELSYKITDPRLKVLEIGQIIKRKDPKSADLSPKIKDLQRISNEAILDILKLAR